MNNKLQKYKSCEHLEYSAVFRSDCIRVCCGDTSKINDLACPRFKINNTDIDNLDELFSRFIAFKQKLKEDINSGKHIICSGCSYLREDNWEPEDTFKLINFSVDYPCNLGCSYCYQNTDEYHYEKTYDIDKLIANVLKSKFVSDDTQFIYASGEIGIHPKIKEIVNLFQKRNVSFFTNATKYYEEIHQLILKPRNSILVSLDCGTRETYQKIKGRDMFNVVCENISRYASDNGNVMLKYILTNDNLNTADLNGFIEFCLSANIKNIRITYDWNIKELNDNLKHFAIILMRKARKNNIKYYVDDTFLCD